MSSDAGLSCPFCHSHNDPSSENCFQCGRGLFVLTRGAHLGGRYEILEVLGHGGMGIVYKSRDLELEEWVAIKVLRPDLARVSDVAKRFRSEIRLARRVRHRNVCAIHEYVQADHLRCIVMEYVEGTDLRKQLLKSGPPAAEDATSLAIQAADGLQAIHEAGIVHRDLKTANMMLDTKGYVRLMDFGIAKSVEAVSAAGVTGTGNIVGTPEYMSPEQVRGQKVDPRTDIYSLGVVTFELVTGDVPFRGDTPVATLMMHLEARAEMSGLKAGIPAPLVPILRRALAKEPADRFGTAAEFAQALRAAEVELRAPRDTVAPGFATRDPDRSSSLHTFGRSWRGGAALIAPEAPAVEETIVPAAADTTSGDRPTDVARVPGARPPAAEPPASLERRVGPRVMVPNRPSRQRLAWAVGIGSVLVALGTWARWSSDGVGPIGSPEASGTPSSTVEDVSSPAAVGQTPAVSSASEPAAAAPSAEPTEPKRDHPPTAARSPDSRRVDRVAKPAASVHPNPVPPVRVPGAAADTPTYAPSAPPPAGRPPDSKIGEARLQIGARPWAEATIDGRDAGTAPLIATLDAGWHQIVLTHPSYQPVRRRVLVRAGEITRVEVDFSLVGIPR